MNIYKKNIYVFVYTYKHRVGSEGGYLPLTRKIRRSGSSIVITIPSQILEAYDISCGDLVEIIPLENGKITIQKVDNNLLRK